MSNYKLEMRHFEKVLPELMMVIEGKETFLEDLERYLTRPEAEEGPFMKKSEDLISFFQREWYGL